MLTSARSRYRLAAVLWLVAASWIALGAHLPGVPALLVGLAVAMTVCAAVVERDERADNLVRMTWWACTAVAPPAPKFPRQGSVPAWPGIDRASDPR